MNKVSPEVEAQRFERLPQWAKSRIRTLEDKVASQKDKIAEISNPHPGSNVVVNGFISYPDQTLPNDSQIDFTMGEIKEGHWRTNISVGHRRSDKGRNVLRIQGDQGLIIRCNARNSFEVSFDER